MKATEYNSLEQKTKAQKGGHMITREQSQRVLYDQWLNMTVLYGFL